MGNIKLNINTPIDVQMLNKIPIVDYDRELGRIIPDMINYCENGERSPKREDIDFVNYLLEKLLNNYRNTGNNEKVIIAIHKYLTFCMNTIAQSSDHFELCSEIKKFIDIIDEHYEKKRT